MTRSNLKRAQVEDVDEDGAARMGFLEHLDELRMRLIHSCVAIGAGMAVSVLFVNRLEDFVLGAVLSSLPGSSSLIYTRPGEGFAFYFDRLAHPKANHTSGGNPSALGLVVAASVFEQARRRRQRTGAITELTAAGRR